MKPVPLLAGACLILANLGCKPDKPSDPVTAAHTETKSATRTGWKEIHCAGVSLSLPPDMAVIDLSKGDLGGLTKTIDKQYPDTPGLAAMVDRAAKNGAVKLVAIKSGPAKDNFQDNINLLVLPAPKGISFDQLIAANKSEIAPLSQPDTLRVENVDLPAGKAAVFVYDGHSAGPQFSEATYFLVSGDKQYYFSFTSARANKDSWNKMAEEAMKTLRFN